MFALGIGVPHSTISLRGEFSTEHAGDSQSGLLARIQILADWDG